MNTEQELKGINAHLNSLYLEMNAIKARVEYLLQQTDNSDPNHYIPKVGEVVLVWHKFLGQRIRVFLRYEKDKSEPYVCIDGELNDSAVRKYIDGCKPVECTWSRCRRLNGEIIEFGCDAKQAERNEAGKTNPYAVDWTNAPDWADVHCWDESGVGYWYGAIHDKGRCGIWEKVDMKSPFTLPDGLDWKLSKTTRPC